MSELLFYQILLAVEFVSIPIIFILLQFVTAPYGRYARSGWGITVPAYIGWFMMEAVSLIVFVICMVRITNPMNISIGIMAFLWISHYAYRTFIFPFRLTRSKKRFPLLIVLFATLFNGINAWINGWYIFRFAQLYISDWLIDPRMIIGGMVFLIGFVIHQHSDKVLLSLRKPGESGYVIPQKGLFRYVTAANYLGEIVQWCGWAVLTWSLPGLAFALFTIANLVPRARKHHIWYKKEFPDYPPERKVLIPFLY